MIIKGGAVGNTGWWSGHLQRDDTNDRATVMEIKGLLATNIEDALREMQAVASGSRSRGNFLYQANLNPQTHESLTPEQWRASVDILEKQLGLEGHQRIVVEHEKKGRVHQHVIWNRIDVDTMRVTDIGGNYYTHERVARTLEQEFGLDPTKSLHGERRPEGRPERAEELWEQHAAQKSGIDAHDIKSELTALWRETDSGKAFAAALDERGYILAQGDRRNFCIVDHAGTAHSLARRIDGAKAKEVNERLADIDRDKLPTVDAAREAQREKHPTPAQAREAWQGRAGAEAAKPERHAPRPESKPAGKSRGIISRKHGGGAGGFNKGGFHEQFKTGNYARAYIRFCQNPLQDLRRWSDDHAPRGRQGDLLPSASRMDDRQIREGPDFRLRQVRDEGRGLDSGFRRAARLTTRPARHSPAAAFRTASRAAVSWAGFSMPVNTAQATAARGQARQAVLVRQFRSVAHDLGKRHHAGRSAYSGFCDVDPMAAGRAGSAAAAVHARYAGLIDAVAQDGQN